MTMPTVVSVRLYPVNDTYSVLVVVPWKLGNKGQICVVFLYIAISQQIHAIATNECGVNNSISCLSVCPCIDIVKERSL